MRQKTDKLLFTPMYGLVKREKHFKERDPGSRDESPSLCCLLWKPKNLAFT